MSEQVDDPTDTLLGLLESALALRDHDLPQVRAFARQTSAKTQALLDSVLAHSPSIRSTS